MKQASAVVGLVCLVAASIGGLPADDSPRPGESFRASMAARAAQLDKAGAYGAAGGDGFYFLASEVRHYGRGPFWGDHAARASAAAQDQDPLAAMLDFHKQLQGAGIRLIVVPVPGKSALYADKLDPALPGGKRLDEAHQMFCEILRKHGIDTIDLVDDYLAMREKGIDSHCRQDAHWSPTGMKAAARKVAQVVKAQDWYAQAKKGAGKIEPQTVEIQGDIVQTMVYHKQLASAPAPEKLSIERVSLDGKPAGSDRQSPILLMGDSHTVVYHEPIEGGIGAQDAGLSDHLAAELGFAPELVANMASGANAPRITLARPPRHDNLAGKKCVVWCFSVREFTESKQGWMKIPVIRSTD
jgi:alginate O-acetyltransferase complex protein AlgJ